MRKPFAIGAPVGVQPGSSGRVTAAIGSSIRSHWVAGTFTPDRNPRRVSGQSRGRPDCRTPLRCPNWM